MFVMLDRGDYWQCAFVIRKGGFDEVLAPAASTPSAPTSSAVAPVLADRVERARKTGTTVKLLTVKVDRLRQWHRPGLLCIGDAAHAMSPIGGVGINLAIQDAVAAANLLAAGLRRGQVTEDDLRRVQQRREMPVVPASRPARFSSTAGLSGPQRGSPSPSPGPRGS